MTVRLFLRDGEAKSPCSCGFWSVICEQPVIPEPLSAAHSSQIVRVYPSQMPDEVEVIGAAPAVRPTSNVQITLRYGAMSVEMPAGMEIAQIADLKKALGQTC